jgi:putative (di)nucleoside polyphosphate hydrolase
MSDNFRPNAGIVVFNSAGKVLLCERSDEEGAWQFPQGGIEIGETPLQAAQRELWEETSLKNVVPVKTLTEPAPYRFPPDVLVLTQSRGWHYVGQKMYWSLFYFAGDENEINLNIEGKEFRAWQWGTLEQAYDLIVDFKKPAYAFALREFAPLIPQWLQKNTK